MFTGIAQAAPGTQHNSIIRSVQYFSITIGAGNTSQDYTLPQAIDKNYAAVDFPGHRVGSGATNSRSGWQSAVYVLDNNTLRAVRQDTSSGVAVTLDGFVVEFEPWAIRKRIEIQRTVPAGTSTDTGAMPSGQTLEPITEILTTLSGDYYYNDGMAAVFLGGCTTTQAGQFVAFSWGAFRLLTGDTAYIYRGGSTSDITMYATILQFNPGITQFFTYNYQEIAEYRLDLATDTSGLVSVATGDLNNYAEEDDYGFGATWGKDYALLLFNGHNQGAFQDSTPYLYIDGSTSPQTRIYAERAITGQAAPSPRYSFVRFHPRWIKSQQRNKANIVGGSTTVVDQTITAVNRAKTLLQYHYVKTDNDFANVDFAQASVRFTSDTNVRSERTVASAKYVETSWQATEFY